jgi:hypothetical protein
LILLVGALLAAPQLARASTFSRTAVEVAFGFVAAGSVLSNRAAVDVGFEFVNRVATRFIPRSCPPQERPQRGVEGWRRFGFRGMAFRLCGAILATGASPLASPLNL